MSVVSTFTGPAKAMYDSLLTEFFLILRSTIFDAAISVQHKTFSSAAFAYRIHQCSASHFGRSFSIEAPANYPALIQVHDNRQVVPLFFHLQIGHISYPDLILVVGNSTIRTKVLA